MGIETALIGSAVIGGASSLLGANKAAKAAKDAAKVNAAQYAETKENVAPYLTAGNNALADLLKSLGLSGETDEEKLGNQKKYFDDFQYDAGFQRFLDDSNKNTMRAYSLYGDTGGNLADALRKKSEGAVYGQFQDRRNALSGLADSGRASAGILASAGQASAAQQGKLIADAGVYQANGIIGAGQAVSNAFGNYAKSQGNQNGFAAANPWAAQTVNRASLVGA